MDTIINAIIWLMLIETFSFSTFPAISMHFKGLSDRGFAISKFLGILISSYLVWILASIHIVTFSRLSSVIASFIVIIVFLFISILQLKIKEEVLARMNDEQINPSKFLQFFKSNKYLRILYERILKNIDLSHLKDFKKVNRLIIIEEVIFIASFAIWTFLRGTSPNIMGTEKFMDFGIMNAILRSNYFPPHDMWLSGFNLNYYYYGQYIFSFITKLTDIPSAFSYNFSISTIFALSMILSFSIVYSLAKSIIGAIISSFVLNLAGNINYVLNIIQYFFQHKNLNGFSFWYPASTRLIPFTINEYPIYSFIVSDLHAHVTDIPVVLISLLTSLNIFKTRKFSLTDIIISGMLIGIIAVTNSWDAIFYSSILLVSVIYIYVITEERKNALKVLNLREKLRYIKNEINNLQTNKILDILNIPFFHAIINASLSILIGVIMFIPFYIFFHAPVDGIGFNNIAHTDPTIEIVLFGFYFFLIGSFIAFLIYTLITKKSFHGSDIFIIYILILGFILLNLPEFFYLKDIFYKANKPYFRANTVFKLYYQTWIMFALASGYIISRLNSIFRLKDIKSLTKTFFGLWDFFILIFLVSIFAYTYISINQGYLNISGTTPATQATQTCAGPICFNSFKTNDGIQYISNEHPDDFGMISWLNKNSLDNSVIAEAVGDSYTYYARISANTGLSTLLGWPNHEYQWRNTYAYSQERESAVFNLYNAGTVGRVMDIIDKYDIKYIIVGDQERLKYPDMNEKTLRSSGRIVYVSGNSYIIDTQK